MQTSAAPVPRRGFSSYVLTPVALAFTIGSVSMGAAVLEPMSTSHAVDDTIGSPRAIADAIRAADHASPVWTALLGAIERRELDRLQSIAVAEGVIDWMEGWLESIPTERHGGVAIPTAGLVLTRLLGLGVLDQADEHQVIRRLFGTIEFMGPRVCAADDQIELGFAPIDMWRRAFLRHAALTVDIVAIRQGDAIVAFEPVHKGKALGSSHEGSVWARLPATALSAPDGQVALDVVAELVARFDHESDAGGPAGRTEAHERRVPLQVTTHQIEVRPAGASTIRLVRGPAVEHALRDAIRVDRLRVLPDVEPERLVLDASMTCRAIDAADYRFRVMVELPSDPPIALELGTCSVPRRGLSWVTSGMVAREFTSRDAVWLPPIEPVIDSATIRLVPLPPFVGQGSSRPVDDHADVEIVLEGVPLRRLDLDPRVDELDAPEPLMMLPLFEFPGRGEPVGADEFAERTGARDSDSWRWIETALSERRLTGQLQRDAARLVIEAIRAGAEDHDLASCLFRLRGVWDPDEVADAMLDALEAGGQRPERRRFMRVRHSRRDIRIGFTGSTVGSSIASGPLAVVWIIRSARCDGRELEPAEPLGRVGGGIGIRTGTYRHPDGNEWRGGRPIEDFRFEVDLEWIVFDSMPPGFQRGLPGPREWWPEPLGTRLVTIVLEGDDLKVR